MCFHCKVISQWNCPVYSDYRDRIHFSLQHVCCIWRKICKQSEDQELILFVSCLLQPLSMVVSVNQCLWEDGTSMRSARCACVHVRERESFILMCEPSRGERIVHTSSEEICFSYQLLLLLPFMHKHNIPC